MWSIKHVQPISEWQVSIAWIPAIIGLTSIISYFYWYPDTSFARDMGTIFGTVWNLVNIVTFGIPSKVVGLFTWTLGGGVSLLRSGFDRFRGFCRWIGIPKGEGELMWECQEILLLIFPGLRNYLIPQQQVHNILVQPDNWNMLFGVNEDLGINAMNVLPFHDIWWMD